MRGYSAAAVLPGLQTVSNGMMLLCIFSDLETDNHTRQHACIVKGIRELTHSGIPSLWRRNNRDDEYETW